MKSLVLPVLALAAFIAALSAQTPVTAPVPTVPGLTLTTTAFPDGGIIPRPYTQDSSTPISPKLDWTHVPAGTVSFALIMTDPDAAPMKTVEEYLHWIIFNIPGTAQGLPENVPAAPQRPDGSIQAKNRAGANGYRGPGAPMVGPDHHYTFVLYALEIKLDLTADATRADVLKAMEGHVLGKGVLVGRFHRLITPPVLPAPAAPATPAAK
jgi:Raf kinase inhibitor-like YbhB/YbcL family protein